MLKTITVFCGSARHCAPAYRQMAREAGEIIARQGRDLVYGSGDWGLMGDLAQGAQQAGGRVIGINVRQFDGTPSAVICDEYAVEEDFAARKAALVRRGDACVALPGGMGTLDELTDLYTQAQLGNWVKPFGLLNFNHYYDGLLMQLRRANADGFLTDADYARLAVAEDMETLLAKLDACAGAGQ
ncbi:MAG: TIGR00730 family Rossman fold protein [Clostridia bacterium]|nr:TIGR00730 family Rossman fold protein [Clostridia bacterium]